MLGSSEKRANPKDQEKKKKSQRKMLYWAC